MKNIVIVNQKGGCGKTLVASNLIASLIDSEKHGKKVSYCLYDLDGQGGLQYDPVEMPDAVVSIVDTPGALQADMGEWVKDADLIIIPTRPTLTDIPATERTIDVVKENNTRNVPVIYVINGMNRFRATQEFMEYFMAEHEGDLVFGLPQSEAFIQSALAGVTIQEYNSKCPAALAMKKLTDAVWDVLGIEIAS